MGLQRQAKRSVVVDDMLAERHDRQQRLGLVVSHGHIRPVEERQLLGGALAAKRPHGPQGGAPVEPERAEGVGLCQFFDFADIEARPQP